MNARFSTGCAWHVVQTWMECFFLSETIFLQEMRFSFEGLSAALDFRNFLSESIIDLNEKRRIRPKTEENHSFKENIQKQRAIACFLFGMVVFFFKLCLFGEYAFFHQVFFNIPMRKFFSQIFFFFNF